MGTSSSTKRLLVTTPIFYVNAKPHIGHLYTAVLSDYVKRVYQLLGYSPVLSTGTDEHGMKVFNAAFKAGFGDHTIGFCDQNSAAFRSMMDKADVSYDYFIRTTDPSHNKAVSTFWENLRSKGNIQLGKHTGYYSPVEEAFIPQKEVIFNYKMQKYIHAKSGTVLEKLSEDNYLFPIGKYKAKLMSLYNEGKVRIPDKFKAQILAELKDLPDELSISRPAARASWGILTPSDPNHTVYVWLDALVNYYSVLGYPETLPKKDSEFHNMIHVVGKDIIRFHSLIWPGLLLANKLPTPKQIIAHNFWLADNAKMSKSLGNVVPAENVLAKYGKDATRFYLLKEGPFERDESFLEKKIQTVYNAHAVNEFANSLYRIISAKVMQQNARQFVIKQDLDVKGREFVQEFNKALSLVYTEDINPPQSIKAIIQLMQSINKYINETEFWRKDEDSMTPILGTAYEALKAVRLLLYPIIPGYTAKASKFFQIEDKPSTLKQCKIEVQKGKVIQFNMKEKSNIFLPRKK